jgi:hypothetical protein
MGAQFFDTQDTDNPLNGVGLEDPEAFLENGERYSDIEWKAI